MGRIIQFQNGQEFARDAVNAHTGRDNWGTSPTVTVMFFGKEPRELPIGYLILQMEEARSIGTMLVEAATLVEAMMEQTIFSGDRVTIKAMGISLTGTCETVQFHGGEYGIELRLDNGEPRYWKQWMDGGTVVKVNEQCSQ